MGQGQQMRVSRVAWYAGVGLQPRGWWMVTFKLGLGFVLLLVLLSRILVLVFLLSFPVCA